MMWLMENDTIDRLKRAVSGHKDVLILTHNNPDPDSLAAAAALRHLIAFDGGPATGLAYGGFIGRAENRALMKNLAAPFERLAGPEFPSAAPSRSSTPSRERATTLCPPTPR